MWLKMYSLVEKKTSDILKIEEILNLAFSSIPKGGKNAPLIKNDSLTSEESKAKTCLQISYL